MKKEVKKKEVVRTREKAQEVADKITPIFQVIGLLSAEDIEYLKDTAKIIRQEVRSRAAVAGILIPLEKSEMAAATGEQAVDRITGLILIWSAIRRLPEIEREYRRVAEQSAAIEKMFGL